MLALSDSDILRIWETGRTRGPVERALLVLQPVAPDGAAERWTIGRRDAGLFDVYSSTFGTAIEGVTVCPECAERLDVSLPSDSISESLAGPAEQFEVVTSNPEYHVIIRLPSSADLQAAAVMPDPESARQTLAESCILRAEQDGEVIASSQLPEKVFDQIDAAMASHDRQSDIMLRMICPSCECRWEADFDIADFLWRVLDSRARQLVADVHVLASAYGWSEREILAMSRSRRELYQELIW